MMYFFKNWAWIEGRCNDEVGQFLYQDVLLKLVLNDFNVSSLCSFFLVED